MNARIVRVLLAAIGVAAAALLLAGGGGAASSQPKVLAIRFGPDLEVNPVTQDYLTSKLSRAAKDGYDAAVILLDTPGGLSTSMKTIYTAELNAKLPVIVYVSPNGARAASAGVWIAQAADVLAMAPTTNIGSSTPIDSSGANLGSDLRRKVINDAAASLTALAVAHHRNPVWPQKAVRVASNLTAQQALKMNVIDMIAPTPARAARQAPGLPHEGRAAAVHAEPRRRADRHGEARLLHAVPERADRPEHHQPALPRRHRRHRLRDLPSRSRAAGRARRGGAARRAVRVLGAADLVGGDRADPVRRGVCS